MYILYRYIRWTLGLSIYLFYIFFAILGILGIAALIYAAS